MTDYAAIALRLAFAIVLDALAFTIWDVGTRPPAQLWRDVAAGARRGRTLSAGLGRLALGFGFLLVAGKTIAPVIPTEGVFTIVETGTLLAALLVEALVGPDLRARWGR